MQKRITIMTRILSGVAVTGALLFAAALCSTIGSDTTLKAATQIINHTF